MARWKARLPFKLTAEKIHGLRLVNFLSAPGTGRFFGTNSALKAEIPELCFKPLQDISFRDAVGNQPTPVTVGEARMLTIR
jgi:hypothetical protein